MIAQLIGKLTAILAAAWEVVSTDRTVQIGAGSSSISLWGSCKLEHAREALALFAAFFGGLSAAAVFVYTCLKIIRLLRNPKSLE